jgi:hypothetical protein
VIANVVSFIAEDRGITVEQAVEVLFSCELSTKIEDVERGIIIIWRVFL